MKSSEAMSLYTAALLAMTGGVFALFGCGGENNSNGHAMHADSQHQEKTMADSNTMVHAEHHHGAMEEGGGAQTHTTKLEFSSEPAAIPVGKSITWNLRILDRKSGEPVNEFDEVHEKLMHLIVVSSDLSWFNHIHPEYRGNGLFTVTTTLPRDGSYKLYADYTPKGGEQEVPQYEFATGGAQPAPTSILPVADVAGTGGWMIKKVSARPEGEPKAPGTGAYQVAMMPMPSTIVAGKDVMLHFQVRDAGGKPLTDLQPYLGEMGHAVILSSDTKTYLHTHPMSGEMEHGGGHGDTGNGGDGNHAHGSAKSPGGSDVMFHANFPEPGLYKVWGEFQHNGKIITASFVVNVGAKAS